jgi:hypothetical protein
MTNGLLIYSMGKYLRISSYIRIPSSYTVWLCNCSTLKFLTYKDNFFFQGSRLYNMLGGGSSWYWTNSGNVQIVDRVCPFSCTGPASCQPGISSVISGELQAGGNSIHLGWLECCYDPPEGHPGQLVYCGYLYIIIHTENSYMYLS